MKENFSLYIKFLDTNQPIEEILKISGPVNGTTLNLISAINRLMQNVTVNADKIVFDDIGQAKTENINIRLRPCPWFYIEKSDLFIGIISPAENYPINALCFLKKDRLT